MRRQITQQPPVSANTALFYADVITRYDSTLLAEPAALVTGADVVLDRAAAQHGAVAHRHPLPDRQRPPRLHVAEREVLDVRVGADRDPVKAQPAQHLCCNLAGLRESMRR